MGEGVILTRSYTSGSPYYGEDYIPYETDSFGTYTHLKRVFMKDENSTNCKCPCSGNLIFNCPDEYILNSQVIVTFSGWTFPTGCFSFFWQSIQSWCKIVYMDEIQTTFTTTGNGCAQQYIKQTSAVIVYNLYNNSACTGTYDVVSGSPRLNYTRAKTPVIFYDIVRISYPSGDSLGTLFRTQSYYQAPYPPTSGTCNVPTVMPNAAQVWSDVSHNLGQPNIVIGGVCTSVLVDGC